MICGQLPAHLVAVAARPTRFRTSGRTLFDGLPDQPSCPGLARPRAEKRLGIRRCFKPGPRSFVRGRCSIDQSAHRSDDRGQRPAITLERKAKPPLTGGPHYRKGVLPIRPSRYTRLEPSSQVSAPPARSIVPVATSSCLTCASRRGWTRQPTRAELPGGAYGARRTGGS